MCTEERKPRPHAEIIKAWADGAIIQYRLIDGSWEDVVDNHPGWHKNITYRVKPAMAKHTVYFRFWWDKEGKLVRYENVRDRGERQHRQDCISVRRRFGGWLSNWEERTFEVEEN